MKGRWWNLSSLLPGKPDCSVVVSAALWLALAAWHPVHAHPPGTIDLALALWFEDLHQPATGLPCCSISDCHETDSRTNGNQYEALIEGKWLAVPPDKVIERTDNPTDRAVVCWLPWAGILCFVKGPES